MDCGPISRDSYLAHCHPGRAVSSLGPTLESLGANRLPTSVKTNPLWGSLLPSCLGVVAKGCVWALFGITDQLYLLWIWGLRTKHERAELPWILQAGTDYYSGSHSITCIYNRHFLFKSGYAIAFPKSFICLQSSIYYTRIFDVLKMICFSSYSPTWACPAWQKLLTKDWLSLSMYTVFVEKHNSVLSPH